MIEVTRKLLDNYQKTKREIPLLEEEIRGMQQGDGGLGHSTIMDYRTGFPRPSSVIGPDWPLYDRRKKALERKREEARAVESWIEDIEDDQTRYVFRAYYIDGMSWEKVAAKIGAYESGESYPRRCIRDAYLNKKNIR